MQAFQTAAYLINILPSKILHFQPLMQLLFNKAPNYHHLRIFSCLCFPSLSPYMIHKLSYKSIPCVFLGYAPAHKGYVCLDTTAERFYISRNVLFHELSFPFLFFACHQALSPLLHLPRPSLLHFILLHLSYLLCLLLTPPLLLLLVPYRHPFRFHLHLLYHLYLPLPLICWGFKLRGLGCLFISLRRSTFRIYSFAHKWRSPSRHLPLVVLVAHFLKRVVCHYLIQLNIGE